MEKQKKIPKLRFPEFEGVWEKKTVGELGVFTGGGTPDTAIAKYWQGNFSCLVFRVRGFPGIGSQ
jgi:type I restriction enzyme S subunit